MVMWCGGGVQPRGLSRLFCPKTPYCTHQARNARYTLLHTPAPLAHRHTLPAPHQHPCIPRSLRLPDSPPPAPARRQPVCHTSPSLSATSGRKLTNEKAPPAITSRLHPTVKLYRISSYHYISLLLKYRHTLFRRPRVSPVGLGQLSLARFSYLVW